MYNNRQPPMEEIIATTARVNRWGRGARKCCADANHALGSGRTSMLSAAMMSESLIYVRAVAIISSVQCVRPGCQH